MPADKLTDRSPMPFGKYRGDQMEAVPAKYLIWLWDNEDGMWSQRDSPVRDYIIENWDALVHEAKDVIITHFPEGKFDKSR